jgi:hypothetical protein
MALFSSPTISHHLPPPSPLPLVVSFTSSGYRSINIDSRCLKAGFLPSNSAPGVLWPSTQLPAAAAAHPSPQDVSTKARPLVVPPPPWSFPAVSHGPWDLRGTLALKIINQLEHQRIWVSKLPSRQTSRHQVFKVFVFKLGLIEMYVDTNIDVFN